MRNPRYLYVLKPNSTVETEGGPIEANTLTGHDHTATDYVHDEYQPALQIEAGSAGYVVAKDDVTKIVDMAELASQHRVAPTQ